MDPVGCHTMRWFVIHAFPVCLSTYPIRQHTITTSAPIVRQHTQSPPPTPLSPISIATASHTASTWSLIHSRCILAHSTHVPLL